MITSEKERGDVGETQVDGGVEVHVGPLVSQDVLPDLASGYLGYQGETLASMAPGTIPVMKMATRESIGMLESRRSSGPVGIT